MTKARRFIISGTISFGLYDLACHPDVQSRLRAEIFECGDNLPFDQIDELPYLDAVVKEIMRINPSLPGTVRQAQKDDIIPLTEPVTLTNGKVVTDIHIQKGQLVSTSCFVFNPCFVLDGLN